MRNKKVIEEINRHKWLESEIAGYDIGFEAAAEDWLKKHAGVWVAYHTNKKLKSCAKPVSLKPALASMPGIHKGSPYRTSIRKAKTSCLCKDKKAPVGRKRKRSRK